MSDWATAVVDLLACFNNHLPMGSLSLLKTLDGHSRDALIAEALGSVPSVSLHLHGIDPRNLIRVIARGKAGAQPPSAPSLETPAALVLAAPVTLVPAEPAALVPLVLEPQPLLSLSTAIAALSEPVPAAWRPLVTPARMLAWPNVYLLLAYMYSLVLVEMHGPESNSDTKSGSRG